MKLADKHEALKNIGEFVRRVEHHLIFLWIDANKRDVHAMCADIKFVMIYLPRKVVWNFILTQKVACKKSIFNSASKFDFRTCR